MIKINRLRPSTLGTAAALATIAACAAFLPATAQAATAHPLHASIVHPKDGTGTTNTNTPLFEGPSTAGGSEITLVPGYRIDLHCWTDGGWYDGTNRWFQVNYFGLREYANADMISNQPSLPHC
jgi:hypothetical protein